MTCLAGGAGDHLVVNFGLETRACVVEFWVSLLMALVSENLCLWTVFIDEGQITHLIFARLEYDLYDCFRGCFGPASCPFSCRKGPKTPPKKVILLDHILGGHRLDE